jgi:hypothetical protein
MIFFIQSPVPHIAFDLKNTGVDCERTVGLAGAICVIGASQINRRRIKKRVVRLVRRWCARGRRILLGEHQMCAKGNCTGGHNFFHSLREQLLSEAVRRRRSRVIDEPCPEWRIIRRRLIGSAPTSQTLPGITVHIARLFRGPLLSSRRNHGCLFLRTSPSDLDINWYKDKHDCSDPFHQGC